MDDKKIVELFFMRSEDAIAEADKKYGRYCHYIARNIMKDEDSASIIVSDTYLKAWTTIPPNKPESLKAYLGMICRQLSLNCYEAKHALKRGGEVALSIDELAECIPDGTADVIPDTVALTDAINRFLGSLPELARRVFVRRYWYAASVSEIAREYSLGESAVTVGLTRTRRKLKDFLIKEGFTV